MNQELVLHISNYAVRHGYCKIVIPMGEHESRLVSFCYRTDMAGFIEAYDFLLTDKRTKRTRPMSDKQLNEFIEKFKVADCLVGEYIAAKELQRYQLINPEGMIYRTFPLRYRAVDDAQCEKLVKFTEDQLIGFATEDPDPFVDAYENNPGLRLAVEVIEGLINQ